MSVSKKPNVTELPSNERILAFSDGVFAIVITLLVLEIKVPELSNDVVAHELPYALFKMIPKILGHVISFAVLGIYWIGHHTMFLYIKRHDRVLLWLNIVFLMFLASMPFPTALLSRYPNQPIAMIIYCGILIMTGLVADAMWGYATMKRRLVSETLENLTIALIHRRVRLAPLMYLGAIIVSFISMILSDILLIMAILVYVVPNPFTDPYHHHLADD